MLGTFELPSDGNKLTITPSPEPISPAGLPIDHVPSEVTASKLILLGYSLPDDMLTQSDANWLTLFWRAETNIEQDYVIALQLLDKQGQEAAYWLGRPVMSGYPTNKWLDGEIVATMAAKLADRGGNRRLHPPIDLVRCRNSGGGGPDNLGKCVGGRAPPPIRSPGDATDGERQAR